MFHVVKLYITSVCMCMYYNTLYGLYASLLHISLDGTAEIIFSYFIIFNSNTGIFFVVVGVRQFKIGFVQNFHTNFYFKNQSLWFVTINGLF